MAHRAAKVRQWLEGLAVTDLVDDIVKARTAELIHLGFKGFDAFHLASAELANAEVFCSCDDRLRAAAGRHAATLKIRVTDPVALVNEVFA